ncbi:MAG: serine/threonine protein kinase [Myxococcota bacterium]|nr:serine/threonine protein kinase [Myxococcota bacterium]
MQEAEPTEVLPERQREGDPERLASVDDTEVGTQAASPHALAEAPAAGRTTASTDILEPKPSAWATASVRPVPTAGEALDRSDLPRMRMFHLFGATAPLGAIALSLLIGGDRLARMLFWAGIGLLVLCNVGLVWLASKPERWKTVPVGVLWIIATIGATSALYYFGPFSAVVMVQMLGIVFIALGRSQWTARSVAGICIGGHVALAVPIIAGWIDDVGVLTSIVAGRDQLVLAEMLIVGFLLSGYALGRWARHTSATALAELQSAMRVIGDQQQALSEHKDDVARQNRVNEGRWTGQAMGSYRLGLVLGRGAMGEVYEAASPDGRSAAVKLLNARSTGSTSLVERFHREMAVAGRLESPHIVKVYEISPVEAPVPYIAMERLHGTDLATRLRTENRLPSDEIVLMIDQVARGLEVARLAGVVHRDLKPHNIFLHEGSIWKILDFGVSKLMDSEGTLTGEGIVGTPQYMAPEQASGGQVTHLADVYALGAIAYRCLTGRTPFKGNDLNELVYQVVHTPPMRPSLLGRVPTNVEDVLALAMAKDPRRRFPSALAFAQAFVTARRGRPVSIDPPPNAWT